MKRYQAILFDADETLLDFRKSEQTAFYNMLDHWNIPPSENLLDLYSSSNKEAWLLFEKGEITKKRLTVYRYERFLEKAGLTFDASLMSQYYEQMLGQTGFLLPHAIDVLNFAREHFSLFIVTNGLAHVQHNRLKNADIAKYFEYVFTSEELKAPKPDAMFFDAVFKNIDFLPQDVLLVGDSLTSDIIGGISYGIDTCFLDWHHTPTDLHPTYTVHDLTQLLDLLKKLG